MSQKGRKEKRMKENTERLILSWTDKTDNFEIIVQGQERPRFRKTDGVVFSSWKNLTEDQREKRILGIVITAIVRDGVNPKVVIEEFRKKLPNLSGYIFPEYLS
jgi:hypothetical protein